MTPEEMETRIVRYGDLIPCKTAFIDAHTPGSDQKENFTIIGGGVSESPDQQPPKCRNSLHNHRTAEVFFVLSGRWRFFWGERGDAGEVILHEGDIINIPTNMFRGFENIGTDYGMIMAVLGGDDAGGGVIWAPHVIEDAKAHGLILGQNGKLYDTKTGEQLPDGLVPMAVLSDAELQQVNEPTPMQVVGGYVRRYLDMVALSHSGAVQVIGENGLIRDRPGFEIDLITRHCATDQPHAHDRPSVLMPVKGHWRVTWDGGGATLAPGDTMSVPEHLSHSVLPSMTGEAALYHIIATDDPAGPTWVA